MSTNTSASRTLAALLTENQPPSGPQPRRLPGLKLDRARRLLSMLLVIRDLARLQLAELTKNRPGVYELPFPQIWVVDFLGITVCDSLRDLAEKALSSRKHEVFFYFNHERRSVKEYKDLFGGALSCAVLILEPHGEDSAAASGA